LPSADDIRPGLDVTSLTAKRAASYDRRMKRKPVGGLLLLLAVGLFCGPVHVGAEGAKLAFNWAFVSRAADGSSAPIDFSERVSIKPGELFKIHIEPQRGTYVYLYLQDAAGDLSLLFPDGFRAFDAKSYFEGKFFIPEGENWFQLDGAKGTERFYLLASTERLKPLESLTAAFVKISDDPASAAAAKASARQAVLDEIARVRKQHSQLTMAAEKPVTIAGGTRGINTSVEKLATRIEATDFYTKTFRLDH
jgi:hypothetical protein